MKWGRIRTLIKMIPVSEMGPDLNINKSGKDKNKWSRIRVKKIKMVPVNEMEPDPNVPYANLDRFKIDVCIPK